VPLPQEGPNQGAQAIARYPVAAYADDYGGQPGGGREPPQKIP